MTNIILVVVVMLVMVSVCYLLSGTSIVAGTIFERKKPVEKRIMPVEKK